MNIFITIHSNLDLKKFPIFSPKCLIHSWLRHLLKNVTMLSKYSSGSRFQLVLCDPSSITNFINNIVFVIDGFKKG